MAAQQAPLSLGFSRQEHWSGLPFPSPMHAGEKWKWRRSVISDPQRPHGLQPTKLLHPWDFPGKSTGVGCHCLLRGELVSTALKSPKWISCWTQRSLWSIQTTGFSSLNHFFYFLWGNRWNNWLLFQGNICEVVTWWKNITDLLFYFRLVHWNGKWNYPCLCYFFFLLSFYIFWKLIPSGLYPRVARILQYLQTNQTPTLFKGG